MPRVTRSSTPRLPPSSSTEKKGATREKAETKPQGWAPSTKRQTPAEKKVATDRAFWDSQVKAGTMRPEVRLYLELKLKNPSLPSSLTFAIADVATGKRASGNYVSEQGLWNLQSLAAEPRVKATLVQEGDFTREPLWSSVMNRPD